MGQTPVISSKCLRERYPYYLKKIPKSSNFKQLYKKENVTIYEITKNASSKICIKKDLPPNISENIIRKTIKFYQNIVKKTKNKKIPELKYLQKYTQLDFHLDEKKYVLIFKSFRKLIKPNNLLNIHKLFENIITSVKVLYSLEIYGLDLEFTNICLESGGKFFPRLYNFLESKIDRILNKREVDKNIERIHDLKKMGFLLKYIFDKYIKDIKIYHIISQSQERKNKTDFFLLFKNLGGYNKRFFDFLLNHSFILGLNRDIDFNAVNIIFNTYF